MDGPGHAAPPIRTHHDRTIADGSWAIINYYGGRKGSGQRSKHSAGPLQVGNRKVHQGGIDIVAPGPMRAAEGKIHSHHERIWCCRWLDGPHCDHTGQRQTTRRHNVSYRGWTLDSRVTRRWEKDTRETGDLGDRGVLEHATLRRLPSRLRAVWCQWRLSRWPGVGSGEHGGVWGHYPRECSWPHAGGRRAARLAIQSLGSVMQRGRSLVRPCLCLGVRDARGFR